jgi:hypothetical protein
MDSSEAQRREFIAILRRVANNPAKKVANRKEFNSYAWNRDGRPVARPRRTRLEEST